MHRTGYTESAAAPGVEPEVRDPELNPLVHPIGWRYPKLHLGLDAVIGGSLPLSLVAVMRSLLNQPGNLS